jgi:acetyl-CoA carboxylase biotin carboxylase subunit
MFRRVLIANRGEVAARVARTCRRLGIGTVAVASAADRGQAWLDEVDEVVGLGGARPAASYLDATALIEAGLRSGATAVHPGWGFLSENGAFAAQCEAAGLTFVGPSPEHMRRMGDKAEARATMSALGMPIIPGSKEPVDTLERAREVADEVGYPVLLKAVSGGGGKGMRAVDHPDDLADAFEAATAEAVASFGDGRLYLERRIVGGRHVEVQVICDHYGNALHLGERECSLQRRHQKVVEEAPSPGLSPAERDRVLPLVADVVARAGYRNAGTVEMLLDADGNLWFMEMNTRLQVEHPVTEQVVGVDLVEWQLRVAAREPLPRSQKEIRPTGHAIECRLNAEDPDDGFKPSPGTVSRLHFPQGEGIRVDTHLTSGDAIPPYYDSMVAKLIVSGADRAQAIERMRDALDQVVIEGVRTNLALHRRIARWEPFTSGQYDTKSLERELMGGA